MGWDSRHRTGLDWGWTWAGLGWTAAVMDWAAINNKRWVWGRLQRMRKSHGDGSGAACGHVAIDLSAN